MRKDNVQFLKAQLINFDYDFESVRSTMGLTKNSLISHLLEMLSNEISFRNNPFHKEKLVLDAKSYKVISNYLSETSKIIDDNTYFVQDRKFAKKIIEMILLSCYNLLEDKENQKKNSSVKYMPTKVEEAKEPINEITQVNNEEIKQKNLIETEEIEQTTQADNEEIDLLFKNLMEELIFISSDVRLFHNIINNFKDEYIRFMKNRENIDRILTEFTSLTASKTNDVKVRNLFKMINAIFNSCILDNMTKESIYSRIVSINKKNKRNNSYKEVQNELDDYFSLLLESLKNNIHKKSADEKFIEKKFGILDTNYSNYYNIPSIVSNTASGHLIDLTKLKTLTFDEDSYGSKEDAFSLEMLSNGYRLNIYIIDPFSYIEKDSLAVKEAFKIGKSLYKKPKTITMFPASLVYGDLSLNQNLRKKVIANSFVFSREFELISFESFPAVISVNANLSFSDFDSNPTCLSKKELNAILGLMEKLEKEYPVLTEYSKFDKNIASAFIRYFKVLTNHTIAKKMSDANLPFIYTVSKDISNINGLIDLIEKQEKKITIPPIVKSYYSKDNIENSFMALSHYAKATTPVRNYVALMNHNYYKNGIINKKEYKDREIYLMEEEINNICAHMNAKEDLISSYIEEQKTLRKKLSNYNG